MTPTGAAHRSVKIAKRLHASYEPTLEAGLAGEVDPAQTDVIVTAIPDGKIRITGRRRH